MEKDKKNNQIQLQVEADKPVIPAGKSGSRILEVILTAPSLADQKPRIPLNLSLVLDRSGSMRGEKLHFVKKAAAHVIDMLTEQDRAAVVLYDDRVETLVPSQFVTQQVKHDARVKIMGVESRASTFLYGGWLQGCRQVAEYAGDQSFKRTLLLTDGLANVGVRDIGALSIHAQELFMRGISTSCFGVGLGYDEHLLESMANHGGGNFHFLETLNAIPLVFEREFDEIINIAVRDVRLTLTLPPAVEAAVSADWHTQQEGQELHIFLGSLTENQQLSVYLQLSNLAVSNGKVLNIPVGVSGKDVDQNTHQAQTTVAFKAVKQSKEVALEPDAELMKRFALVDLADKANQALKKEKAGDRVGAFHTIQNSMTSHHGHISEATVEKYQMMSKQINKGLKEDDRKRHHRQEYETKRGWQSVRDYQLSMKTGLLIAEIEGQSVLINTAAPVTVGAQPEWIFMNKYHKLPREHQGLSCDTYSRFLGTGVEVILGMDVLKGLYINVNGLNGLVQFSDHHLLVGGTPLPLSVLNGILTCRAGLDGKKLDMCLMTANQLSYLPDAILKNRVPVGSTTDIFPGLGEFETAFYELPISLRKQNITLRCGRVPAELQQRLGLSKTAGLLGAGLFKARGVTLAFPEKMIILQG
jgi:Ca-activated chloride channel homolog